MKKILEKLKINRNGFTLFEVMVSISLFSIIMMLTGSMYTISQRAYNKGSVRGELAQNARVSLDRMTREIRQSVEIVTSLPETDEEVGNPPDNEIFFQDGHDVSQITYLRYYLSGTDLKRSIVVYYFDDEPETYVLYNSIDEDKDPPNELVLEDRVVGEYFNNLEFWGADGLVAIRMNLKKDQDELNIRTKIFSRN